MYKFKQFLGQLGLENKVNSWLREKGDGIEIISVNQTCGESGVYITIFYKTV